MEKLVQDEITKYLIILGGGGVAMFMIFSKLITKIKGAFAPYKKQNLYYLVVFMLVFALVATTAHPSFIQRPFTAFLFLQFFFLIAGAIHMYYLQHYMRWVTLQKTFVPELLFTIMVAVFGCIGFLLVYRLMNKNGMEYLMTASVVFFIIPFFFYNMFIKAISIPPKILKEWFYPLREEIEDPEESKLRNLLVISFEFRKKTEDHTITNFRAKAPVDMEFGQLFYYFINDYNDRHPDSKVQFINNAGEPNGWVFYKKHRWFTFITDYIDAEKTIFNNHIKENDVIICTRSLI